MKPYAELKTLMSAAALLAAPLALLSAPAMAGQGDGDGQDATRCISLSDGALVNNCSFVIEAVWCVENVDCRNGKYTNMGTIGARSSRSIYGGRSGNQVRWGACKGRNTISTYGMAAYSWEHICNSE